MSLDVQLLKEICETPGAPGFESPIRAVVEKQVKRLVDEIQIDNMGNLIDLKRGTAISSAISIPTRHMHQVIEMAHKKDILDAIKLLKSAVTGLDKHDWAF